MMWISINEQWPEPGEWVLLGGPSGVEQGYHLDGKNFFFCRTDSYDEPIKAFPTHWMYMPEPPTEQP